ncbi:hypothetical protein NECAME_04206 [Necator americanus]|uniref:Uncharacterized protein n=1 Tax=Necator americanus TaxID=51031 RepID=W2SW54_NECAM|nr:hypothetical protein NECAME_04206 [Necator americanus]ETN73984.1 hypothetical protein NECAME_04206 [Necator americanus]
MKQSAATTCRQGRTDKSRTGSHRCSSEGNHQMPSTSKTSRAAASLLDITEAGFVLYPCSNASLTFPVDIKIAKSKF